MTFKEIQDDALDMLNYTLTGNTDARIRIKRHINEWYRRILARPGFSRLRDGTTTLATVIGQAEYSVAVPKIVAITDPTSDDFLDEVSLVWIRQRDPDGIFVTGNPTHYAIRKTGQTGMTLRLYPTPGDVRNLTIDTGAAVTALSADGDVPVIHEDYHYLLSLAAQVREFRKKDDSRFRDGMAELESGIKDYRYFLRKSHTHHLIQGNERMGRSRLGPWFPADE